MTTTTAPGSVETPEHADEGIDWGQRVTQALSPAKIGGVYVLLIMIVVFSIWVPDTFPQADTVRQILNVNAISAMAALTLVIPLSAGVFDISVPYTMTLSGVLCTYAIVDSGQSIAVGIIIAMVASVLVGCMNGLVVVTFKIDSLIGTLATGFLIQALVQWRTGSRNVTGPQLTGSFKNIAQKQPFWNLTLAGLLRLLHRPRDLVRARAHGHRSAHLRHRLQP